MSFTNLMSQQMMDYVFGKGGSFVTPPTIYVGLSTADPGDTGAALAEPVGNAYARVATSAGTWSQATLANPSVITNSNPITMLEATGSWGTCTHFVLFDASTGGNVLGSEALDVPKAPTACDTPRFPTSSLSVTLT